MIFFSDKKNLSRFTNVKQTLKYSSGVSLLKVRLFEIKKSRKIKSKMNNTKIILYGLLFLGATNFYAQKSVDSKKQQKEILSHKTWISDNGNGTFTNPLFHDEFSDPDLIRVGEDYYLTGTTMHAMPGLPVLHSKDLVNWEFLTYVVDKLDFGPEYRLENNRSIYGQGIWAPCIRYNKGVFYIFTNVNGQGTQMYTASDPKGPWKHTRMKKSFHDLSVLFDDDGKVYVIWGYQDLKIAELNENLDDIIPGTEKVLISKDQGAGEGCHFYKIDGKYYITNTNYDPLCYQVCLRSDKPTGPYEVQVMSAEESLGVGTRWRVGNAWGQPPFDLIPPVANYVGCIPMHQGGIVQTQTGEWWGWSMMDYNSIGRVTNLSPVTWKNGWPYFGLEGNLTRSPRTWVKPNTGAVVAPKATFERSDDFSVKELKPIWQWNHVPDNSKWSLKEKKGSLRLYSLPATSFWHARNTITQRGIGPESVATAEIDVKGLKDGDIAGLALLNVPYAWIGISKTEGKLEIQQFYQQDKKLSTANMNFSRLWLRVHCNFDTDEARFSYSTDGANYEFLGGTIIMPFSLHTFQGVRLGLFNYNSAGVAGGYADFNSFDVNEPRYKGLTKPIPYDKVISLTSLADNTVLVNWNNFVRPVGANDRFAAGNASHFKILDRGKGRVALQSIKDGGFVAVRGSGYMAEVRVEKEEKGEASLFQWIDMLQGDLMLMSIKTHRYLFADPSARSLISADAVGTRPDRKDGACFKWELMPE